MGSRTSLKVLLLLVVALLVAVAAGCGGDDDGEASPAPPAETGGGATPPPAEEVSGTVEADGSSTVGPLTTAAAELFQEANRDVTVTVGISGTGGGFERFCAGETDISDASRPIKEDEEVADLPGERRRVRRAAGRRGRAHRRRERGERLGDVPDR